MAPGYNLNHVTNAYPFMTCLVKVNTRSSWQKTVTRVLNKCHGVYSFRMDDNGVVEISGTVDPNMLLKMLGKAGSKAELRWLQFGECSSNLFMPMKHTNIGGYYGGTTYSQDGRYLHSGDITRPKLPSQDSQNHHYPIDYDYKQDYYDQYVHNHNHQYQPSYDLNNNQDYYQFPYNHKHDYHQAYDYGHDCQHNDFGPDNQNYVRDYRDRYNYGQRGEDIGCCTVM